MGVSKTKISLIMPAYNEEENVEEAIKAVDNILRQTDFDYEIIVVDDGSTDDTLRRAVKCADDNNRVKILGHEKNIGKGYAIKTGFEHATGEAIVFMDSDLEIDPRQIGRYAQALEHGDIVISSKWHPDSHVEMPLARRLLSHAFNVLVKLLTGLRVSETQTGLKAAKRRALEEIFPKLAVKRYTFDVELLTVANLYNLKIVELPVNIRLRKLFNLREIRRMFIDLLGITYRLRIRRWYQRSANTPRSA